MRDATWDMNAALSGLDALHDIACGEEDDSLLFNYHFGVEINDVFALLRQHAPDFAGELGELMRVLPHTYGLRTEDLSSEVRSEIAAWRAKYLQHPYRVDQRIRDATRGVE